VGEPRVLRQPRDGDVAGLGVAEDLPRLDAIAPGVPGREGAGEGIKGVLGLLELAPGAGEHGRRKQASNRRVGGNTREIAFEPFAQVLLVREERRPARVERAALVTEALGEPEGDDVEGVLVHLEGVASRNGDPARVEVETALAEQRAQFGPAGESLPLEEVGARLVRGRPVAPEGARELAVGGAPVAPDEGRVDRGHHVGPERAKEARSSCRRGHGTVEPFDDDPTAGCPQDAEAAFARGRPGEVEAGEGGHAGIVVRPGRATLRIDSHGRLSHNLAMPDVLEALSARRARRAISASPIPADVLGALWAAASLAPSHGNVQSTRLLVAATEPMRAAVFEALSQGNRNWAGNAAMLVAIAALPSHDTVQANSDGTTRDYWAYHAGIVTGNLLAQATALGLIAHPMAGFDEPAVRAAFDAPDELRVLAVVALGYPGPIGALSEDLQQREEAPQRRLPIATLVAIDRWEGGNGLSWREFRDRPGG
jgi:nitroreductase